MRNSPSGLSLTAIVLGMCITVVLFLAAVSFAVKKNEEKTQNARREATRLSDLGFQSVIEQSGGIDGFVNDSSNVNDTVHSDAGWYVVNLKKQKNGDTIHIRLTSEGHCGKEKVEQSKMFTIIAQKTDSGVVWGLPQKE